MLSITIPDVFNDNSNTKTNTNDQNHLRKINKIRVYLNSVQVVLPGDLKRKSCERYKTYISRRQNIRG